MRLNKVSELIHNSSNHQNLESAGVSVHFQEIVDMVYFLLFRYQLSCQNLIFGAVIIQDDGAYRAVEGSNFVITRVAFRDNSSKYYINDRGSSFTEVTKKLKAKGVDLDNNRFLILQVCGNTSTKLFFLPLFLRTWAHNFQEPFSKILYQGA